MGFDELYLNRWSLEFDLEEDILSSILVWMRLPHLSLNLRDASKCLKVIGNKLRRYEGKSKPKAGLYLCDCICIEVNIEKGLPNFIEIHHFF